MTINIPEQPLNPGEQLLWNWAVADCGQESELDHVEQAARDCRIVDALQIVLKDQIAHYEYDFEEISYQIAGDYLLDPDEVVEAFDIAEDRIIHE